MKRKGFLFILIALVGAGIMAILYFVSNGAPVFSAPPELTITQPNDGQVSVISGQGVIVLATAYGVSPIERIDLLDGEEVLGSHYPSEIDSLVFSTPFNWFASQIGGHELTVIAYDKNGQASEPETVLMRVFPREEVRLDGIPNNIPADQFVIVEPKPPVGPVGEDFANGDQGNTDNNNGDDGDGNGGNNGEAGGNAAEGQGENPEPNVPAVEDRPLDDLPLPEAADMPPEILSFGYELEFIGGGFLANYIVESWDDIEIDFISIGLEGPEGQAFGIAQPCIWVDGVCLLGGQIPLTAGQWVLTAQAFDTSGQASGPDVLLVEVIGELGEPPAAAEHDEAWADWFADALGDFANPQFDFGLGGFGQFLDGFDLDALGALFGDDEADPADDELLDDCIIFSADVTPEGVEISAEIECAFEAADGSFLVVLVNKRVLHTGDGGVSSTPPGWFDESRTSLNPSDTFTWVDTSVICGNEYEFSVSVAQATRDGDLIRYGRTLAYGSRNIRTGLCFGGSIGAKLNLRIESVDGLSTDVLWDIEDVELPDDPIYANGLLVELIRYSEAWDERIVLRSAVVSPEEIDAGLFFRYEDAGLDCALEYWYTVQIIGADAPYPAIDSGWLAQQSVRGNILPCPDGELEAFDVSLSTFWYNNRYYRALVEVSIPADYPFDPADLYELEVQLFTPESGACERLPCDGVWSVRGTRRVHPDFDLEMTPDISCGDYEHQIRLALVRMRRGVVEREYLAYTSTMAFQADGCPPPTPEIVSLEATTANCPGGVERCVIVHYAPYVQHEQAGVNRIAQLIIERQTQGDFTQFSVNMALDLFVDTNPTLPIENHAVGAPDCKTPSMYRIYAVDEFGRWYGASPLVLYGLTCDGEWNEYAER